jgi:hypothetical protein
VPTKRSAIASAFGDSMGVFYDLDPLAAEDLVECPTELGVVGAHQEPRCSSTV